MAKLSKLSLPLGTRFCPYDVELVMYYLKRKVAGRKFKLKREIPDIVLKNYSPSEVREMSYPKTKDLERFFFSSLGSRYSIGQRKNRSGKDGFWKPTGKDKPIYNKSRKVGWRRTLTFYRGKAPGTITDSRIHEYGLERNELPIASNTQNEFVVLCKISEQKSRGPKTDEGYESPVEEDSDDSVIGDDGSLLSDLPAIPSSSLGPEEGQNTVATISTLDFEDRQDAVLQALPTHTATPIVPQHHLSSPGHEFHKFFFNNVSDEDGNPCNGSVSHQVDSVPSKSTVEDLVTHENYKGFEDRSDDREKISIYNSNSWKRLEEENLWQDHWSPGFIEGFMEVKDFLNPVEEDCGAYIELKDLRIPMAADVSSQWISDFPLAPNVTQVLPAREAMDSSESIWGHREPTCDSAAYSPLKTGVIVRQYAPQSLARGRQLHLHLGLECIPKERWFLTNVQFLLGSIVACPASATVYPSSVDCESYRVGCGFSCSIIVKDEVTIIYTNDGLLGVSRGFPLWSYVDLAEMVTIGAISMSINFMFVHILRAVAAFTGILWSLLVPNLGGIHGFSICSSYC